MWMEIVTPFSKFVFYINNQSKKAKLFKENKKVLFFSIKKENLKQIQSASAEWETDRGVNKPGNNK